MQRRVVLADRDTNLLETYRRFLLRDGFDVLTASNGLDCVAKLRAFQPDVLVLEPALPWGGSDGVLAMIYEDCLIPFLPVMLLASSDDSDGECRVGIFPVSAYHVKPLSAPTLADKLRQLLSKKLPGSRPHALAQEVLQS